MAAFAPSKAARRIILLLKNARPNGCCWARRWACSACCLALWLCFFMKKTGNQARSGGGESTVG
jgi:hypothetical protein